MCGRYTLTVDSPAPVLLKFGVEEAPPVAWKPRFNIAPTQSAPVVTADADGRRELSFKRWGLIPSWAKDPSIGSKLINARSETVAEKPSFRKAFLKRRCLVPADGFYEWQRIGEKKAPVRIRLRESGLFGLAGLWEVWTSPEGEVIESYTILTTDANRVLRPIHDRMPVILPEDQFRIWLDPELEDPQSLEALFLPFDDERLVFDAVSTRVNSPRNDTPDLIAPLGAG